MPGQPHWVRDPRVSEPDQLPVGGGSAQHGEGDSDNIEKDEKCNLDISGDGDVRNAEPLAPRS